MTEVPLFYSCPPAGDIYGWLIIFICIEKGIWNKVSDSGSSPSPRTIHCGASSGDKMFIWGGGKLGPDPVPDVRLHTFDAVTRCWSHHDLIGINIQ